MSDPAPSKEDQKQPAKAKPPRARKKVPGEKREMALVQEAEESPSPVAPPPNQWVALILGVGLLGVVFVTLCWEQHPSLTLEKCLRFFLGLGAALVSYLISGKLAVEFQGQTTAVKGNRASMKIAGSTGFAVFLLLVVFYDPLDARPLLAQWGFIKPDAEVAATQRALAAQTDYKPTAPGVADGDYVRKIAQVQNEHGLPVTGVISAQALSGLVSLQAGAVVLYRSVPALLNTDGPGGSRQDDPEWVPFTAIRYPDGRSVDSRQVPLLTIPVNHRGAEKLQLGDLAVVYWPAQKKHVFAVVGDLGPRARGLLEVSPALVSALGLPARKAASASYDVTAAVFAHTSKPLTLDPVEIQRRGAELFINWGGEKMLEENLSQVERVPIRAIATPRVGD